MCEGRCPAEGHLYASPPPGPEDRDAPGVTSLALTLALSWASSSASLPFFLALEETEAASPSSLSACLVFFLESSRILSWTTAAFLLSTASPCPPRFKLLPGPAHSSSLSTCRVLATVHTQRSPIPLKSYVQMLPTSTHEKIAQNGKVTKPVSG